MLQPGLIANIQIGKKISLGHGIDFHQSYCVVEVMHFRIPDVYANSRFISIVSFR